MTPETLARYPPQTMLVLWFEGRLFSVEGNMGVDLE